MSHQHRILVVDDEESTRVGLTRLLESWGHQTRSAPSAETAIETALSHQPDLIVTDLRMPGRGGIELITDLKEAGIDATVIVITGHDAPGMEERARMLGAVGYLKKPVDRDDLLFAIEAGRSSSRSG